MEVDLQSLFGLHVTWCDQLHSLAETPQLPPPPVFGLALRWRYWSAKIDDISLWLPGKNSWCKASTKKWIDCDPFLEAVDRLPLDLWPLDLRLGWQRGGFLSVDLLQGVLQFCAGTDALQMTLDYFKFKNQRPSPLSIKVYVYSKLFYFFMNYS